MDNNLRAELGTIATAHGSIACDQTLSQQAAEAIANILHYVNAQADDATPEDVLNSARLRYSAEIAEAQSEKAWTAWRKPDHASSQIVESRYNHDEQIMAVRFKGDAVYHYENVPPSIFEGLNKDASAGSFLHKVVKLHADLYPATKQ